MKRDGPAITVVHAAWLWERYVNNNGYTYNIIGSMLEPNNNNASSHHTPATIITITYNWYNSVVTRAAFDTSCSALSFISFLIFNISIANFAKRYEFFIQLNTLYYLTSIGILYKVSHFNLNIEISRKQCIFEKNISNKSCTVWKIIR